MVPGRILIDSHPRDNRNKKNDLYKEIEGVDRLEN